MLDNGEITRKKFTDICTSFYNLCINYLKDWTASNQHLPELNSLSWIFMLQTNEISWSNLKLSINFVKSKLNIVLNEEQFKLFEKLVKEKSTEWHSLTFEEKWISIFKSFKETNTDYSTLLKLVKFAFELPGSNAAVERIFSLMNNYWKKSRNSLGIDTVEATLVIKTNLENKPCKEFYDEISKNKNLLIQVHKTSKYSWKNQASENETSRSQQISKENSDELED